MYCTPSKANADTVYDRLIKPQLHSAITEILLKWPKTQENQRQNAFELLGIDGILSKSYQLSILEVNINAGLHLLSSVVENHHSKVIGDTIDLVIERWERERERERERC